MSKLHPDYQEIEVVQTNGASFKTRSTSKNRKLVLEIDTHTHPAWQKNKGNYINTSSSKVAQFFDKFKGTDFTKIASKSAAKVNKNDEEQG